MRLAEKEGRVSTCAFADEVAAAVISAYRSHAPRELQEAYRQTVIAGFLLLDSEASTLTCVALGVGTKVRLQTHVDVCRASATISIRDMHGEVLARRALQRFLCSELQQQQLQADDGRRSSIFSVATEDGRMGLRAGLSLHLYSSSQPCGNACVKRWAKSKRPFACEVGMGRFEWPADDHARLHVSARTSGQVAPLLKRVRAPFEVGMGEGEEKEGAKGKGIGVTFTFPPPGTALCPPSSSFASSKPLSCSDKIAKWQCLGLQGSLLGGLLLPVTLSTITVGRKFSKVHLERAACCRYQDWQAPGGYTVQHPSMLCTASKFDLGVLEDLTAAFEEWRCFAWWCNGGDGEFDVLDGRSGSSVLRADTTSPLCSLELKRAAAAVGGPEKNQSHVEAKRLFIEYTERQLMM